MRIAQISDTHVKARNVLLFGSIDAFDHFENLVARIEALDPKPDIVIHTGDITNDGEEADFAAAAECLARLSMPVIITLGNHDLRETARPALGHLPGVPRKGRFAYAVDDYPVRMVMVDTLVEGAPHGVVGAEQLRWLDETLARAPKKPTFVCLHHPPFATGIGFMDRIGLRDRAEFGQVISRHDQVVRVLAGHVHRPFTTNVGGAVAMTCPGAAHQVTIDFRADGPERWCADPPGFLLHQWTGTEVVSIELPVEVSPPRPFSDDHASAAPA